MQVWGVILGVGNQSFSQNWTLIGNGVRLWEVRAAAALICTKVGSPSCGRELSSFLMLPQSIDPTLLLTAFLPILLFAGAFALEWHTVRRLVWSSLLLAGITLPFAWAYFPSAMLAWQALYSQLICYLAAFQDRAFLWGQQ